PDRRVDGVGGRYGRLDRVRRVGRGHRARGGECRPGEAGLVAAGPRPARPGRALVGRCGPVLLGGGPDLAGVRGRDRGGRARPGRPRRPRGHDRAHRPLAGGSRPGPGRPASRVTGTRTTAERAPGRTYCPPRRPLARAWPARRSLALPNPGPAVLRGAEPAAG